MLTKAHDFLRGAERIYFLGFGYDETNMQRLFVLNGVNLLEQEKLGGKCFGTAMGIKCLLLLLRKSILCMWRSIPKSWSTSQMR